MGDYSAMQRVEVFCRHCGATPGRPTTCSGKYGSDHSWEHLKGAKRVYCRHCGVIPGSPSECPSSYGEHSWEVLKH